MDYRSPHSTVYMVTNRIDGKRYVGVTHRLYARRRFEHEWEALHGTRVTCRYFHAAIRKHGVDAFEWKVVAIFPDFEIARAEEVRLIAELRPEYNLTVGGQGTKGRVVSEEQRRRHSELMTGRKPKPGAHAKRVAKIIGQKRTPEQRERMGAARRGKPFSEQHKKNLSLALRRYFLAGQGEMEFGHGG